ncbi:MAG: VOC family protein [Myxococcota bacterium]|nr:VOC family protein [Myxococcota bacterium]
MRFNHMELTLPVGVLARDREDIRRFYGEVFGFESLDVPILNQTGLLLRTDPETSQFLLVTEQRVHMTSPGYDHLGFLYESRAEVDALLEQCRKWQARDARVEIKEYDDLEVADTTVRAFYVRYLLPIWFDVQVIEQAPGSEPSRRWTFG